MPKKTVRTSARAPSKTDPVAALIDAASVGTTKDAPSAEALDALRRILAHNDAQTANVKRVGSGAAIEMLQTHFQWKGGSKSALDSLCRRALGRNSWGRP
jgi:hypothetical protein